jgi:hypothetical protein
MSTDRAVLVLLRLDEVVVSIAVVLFVVAIAAVAIGLVARLREPPGELYDLVVPPGATLAAELLFTHLHAVLRRRRERVVTADPRLILVAQGTAAGLGLRARIANRDVMAVRTALDILWPGSRLVRISSARLARAAISLEFRPRVAASPVRATSLPGATAALARAIARAEVGEELSLELTVQPVAPVERTSIAALLASVLSGSGPHADRQRAIAMDRHAAALARSEERFDCRVTIVSRASSRTRAWSLMREFEPSVRALCAGTAVQLGSTPRRASTWLQGSGAALLTPSELAILFPIGALAAAETFSPSSLGAPPGERLLGLRAHAARDVEVRLSIAESRHHLHLLGPTGTGKSTLLLNLASQDIAAGRGCAVLDPKGDLVRELLSRIPRERVSDVVYLGPDEGPFAVAINPLALAPHEDPDLANENVLSIFKRIYHENWGPRTDDVLKACLLTLRAVPEPTLAHIPALLTEPEMRKKFTGGVADTIGLRGFWRWYDGLSEAKRMEATAPLLNKVRDFLLRPRLRRLLCQPHSTIDVRALIDDGGILLADLGTGRWGENASALAGSFLVARIWQAALARQAVDERRRPDFQLYIDEFQSFLGIGGPFADALAQARGLRLSLTIANQHLAQLPHEVQEAVRANAGSRVVFRCAASDASALAREFAPLDAATLSALPRFQAAVRLASSSASFMLRTLPPARPPADAPSVGEVLRASGKRFGRPISDVDDTLRSTFERHDEAGEEPSSERTEG